jgi:hypothetical protein
MRGGEIQVSDFEWWGKYIQDAYFMFEVPLRKFKSQKW